MKLVKILENCDFSGEYSADTEIHSISYNSKNADADSIFAALVGASTDGHLYVRNAYDNGCRVFVTEHEVDLPQDATVLIVKNSRTALSRMSANFFCHPSKAMRVIGVTGTNGKTTVTYMLARAFKAVGKNVGVIGTNGALFNDKSYITDNTTPESFELQRILRDMADGGCEYVFAEVSSLGLKQNRTDDVKFYAGVFTNFSEDHIGGTEHKNINEYLSYKKRLFLSCENAVLNADDKYFDEFKGVCECPFVSFGINNPADVSAVDIERVKDDSGFGVRFKLVSDGIKRTVGVGIPAVFTVYNVLSVAAVMRMCGLPFPYETDCFGGIHVDGRFECFKLSNGADVIVDYAHNKEGAGNVLKTLSEYSHGKIITVFGSVGERAQIRRKGLAESVSKYSDIVIITSDDPARENPFSIAMEEAHFVREFGKNFIIAVDRREAVRKAFELSEKSDFVVLLGKGHEKYQKMCNGKIPFSDIIETQNYINESAI